MHHSLIQVSQDLVSRTLRSLGLLKAFHWLSNKHFPAKQKPLAVLCSSNYVLQVLENGNWFHNLFLVETSRLRRPAHCAINFQLQEMLLWRIRDMFLTS